VFSMWQRVRQPSFVGWDNDCNNQTKDFPDFASSYEPRRARRTVSGRCYLGTRPVLRQQWLGTNTITRQAKWMLPLNTSNKITAVYAADKPSGTFEVSVRNRG